MFLLLNYKFIRIETGKKTLDTIMGPKFIRKFPNKIKDRDYLCPEGFYNTVFDDSLPGIQLEVAEFQTVLILFLAKKYLLTKILLLDCYAC